MREVNVYDKLRQKAIMKIIIQKESREKYCFKIGVARLRVGKEQA